MQNIIFIALLMLVTACSGYNSNTDLNQFIDNVVSKPRGVIEPIPEFVPYEFFRYQSIAKRSPFSLPKSIEVEEIVEVVSSVEPDLNRSKQKLESYDLNDIEMVGMLSRSKYRPWVLLKTPDGLVHRVRPGSYIGKNHGRINRITDKSMDLTEIVPNGFGGWMERPTSITLNGTENF